MPRHTVLIADDHPVVREGLRAFLAREPGLDVVGEVTDGLEVADRVAALAPDVLLLDLLLPGKHGLDVVRDLALQAPATRVVVLSVLEEPAYAHAAFSAGALAYVGKQAGSAAILEAVRAAVEGRRYLGPPLTEAGLESYRVQVAGGFDPLERLTDREREVFFLAVHGLTAAASAARLGISGRTVETHRANLKRKLGVRTHAELVRLAAQLGRLPPETRSRP